MSDGTKTVLVTGASGLLGIELTNQLMQDGVHVKALYHKHPIEATNTLMTTICCDLLDVVALEEVMEGVTEVYHCAGLISYVPNQRDALYKINAEATANVVNACLDAGVRKLVHVSSIAALGRMEDGVSLDETAEWKEHKDQSNYGHSKFLGEAEVWRGIAEGLNAVVVNPSIVLGPGDWLKGSTAIFGNVWNGFKYYSNGVNGFVDVRDVAAAMRMLMHSDITAERFILNGGNYTYKEVFNTIADAFGKPRPYKKVTPFLAELVWRAEKIKSLFTSTEPLITKETGRVAQMRVYYKNTKLLTLFPDFKYKSLENSVQFCCIRLLQHYVNKS